MNQEKVASTMTAHMVPHYIRIAITSSEIDTKPGVALATS